MTRSAIATYALLIISTFIFSACSTSRNEIHNGIELTTVYLQTEAAELESHTRAFSEQAQQTIKERSLVDSVSHVVLKQLMKAYPDKSHFEVTKDIREAELVIRLRQLKVAKRPFTVNFLHPGPIYILRMNADVTDEEGSQIYTFKGQTNANMAWEQYGDEVSHWLSDEEKNNVDNQVETFISALRRNCYDLFTDFFQYNR